MHVCAGVCTQFSARLALFLVWVPIYSSWLVKLITKRRERRSMQKLHGRSCQKGRMQRHVKMAMRMSVALQNDAGNAHRAWNVFRVSVVRMCYQRLAHKICRSLCIAGCIVNVVCFEQCYVCIAIALCSLACKYAAYSWSCVQVSLRQIC